MRQRDREKEGGRDRGRSRLPTEQEPNVGLNPRTLGSQPEQTADTQPLNHPGTQYFTFLNNSLASENLMMVGTESPFAYYHCSPGSRMAFSTLSS